MDEETRKRLAELSDRIADVLEMCADLTEEKDFKIPDVRSCHAAIDAVVKEYKAILAEASEADQLKLERRYGRKVINMRQRAAFLPTLSGGQDAVKATDSEWPFLQQHSGTINSPPPRHIPSADELKDRDKLRVGGDVDAWCGACDQLRLHTIVAMVNEKPKQLVCCMCGARHGFRLTPARSKKSKGLPQQVEPARQRKPRNTKAEKAKEALMALQKELSEATDVRPFSSRARYKAGQIIDHPDHGRGKIENVLRGSMLVRFRTGLKPVSLL